MHCIFTYPYLYYCVNNKTDYRQLVGSRIWEKSDKTIEIRVTIQNIISHSHSVPTEQVLKFYKNVNFQTVPLDL